MSLTHVQELLASKSIYIYQTNELLDYVILQWLERMRRDNELTFTLSESVRTPLQFLCFFINRPLLYRVDAFGNLTHACWFEFTMGSAFMSYYVLPEARVHHKQKVFFLYDCIDAAFMTGINSIAGLIQHRATDDITRRFINIHERLGYTYSGRAEQFFDGRDCHLVSMTRDAWENNNNGWKSAWRRHYAGTGGGQPVVDAAGIGHGEPNGAAAAGSYDARDASGQIGDVWHPGPAASNGYVTSAERH